MDDPETLAERLRRRSTDELIALLAEKDLDEWQPEVFDLARRILVERGLDAEAAVGSYLDALPRDEPSQLETVASFATLVDAEPCRSGLLAAGFRVFLVDANTIAVDPALWPALGGVKLAVPMTEAEEARSFLKAGEDGELAASPEVAIHCPSCGSAKVGLVSRLDRVSTVGSTLLAGVVAPIHASRYVCNECGAAVTQA